jgi:hypothetical protein
MFCEWRPAMQPFRATLADDAGQAIAEIEGSIQSPDETQGPPDETLWPRRGKFELEENVSFMQGVLEGKPFRLKVDDGSQLTILVDSASPIARPGYSKVEFSCL